MLLIPALNREANLTVLLVEQKLVRAHLTV